MQISVNELHEIVAYVQRKEAKVQQVMPRHSFEARVRQAVASELRQLSPEVIATVVGQLARDLGLVK